MAWANSPLRVYHGTDVDGADNIAPSTPSRHNGIDLARCSPLSDFGRGFYTTTNRRQAESWANQCAAAGGRGAAVVGFTLAREQLGSLEHLAFVRASPDFYDLVAFSRGGGVAHGKSDGLPFDVVYGPVCIWPQRFVISGCDQIGFHTARAVATLEVTSRIVAFTGLF